MQNGRIENSVQRILVENYFRNVADRKFQIFRLVMITGIFNRDRIDVNADEFEISIKPRQIERAAARTAAHIGNAPFDGKMRRRERDLLLHRRVHSGEIRFVFGKASAILFYVICF